VQNIARSVRRKEWQIGAVMDWLQLPFLIPLCHLAGRRRQRSWEWKSEVQASKKWELGGRCFRFLSLLLNIQYILNWQYLH